MENNNWYETTCQNENDWYAQSTAAPAAHPTKKRKRVRWIGLGVILVLVLSAGAYFFTRDPAPAAAETVSPPPAPMIPAVDTQEPILPEDYREYFDALYGTIEQPEVCNIPRVENYDKSLSLTMSEKGTKPLSYTEIYEKCAPCVVGIHAYVDAKNANGFYWGTGFIIREDGYILTNAHIIEGSAHATVTTWDDRVYDALLVGYDSQNDLAVLKIEASGLTAAEFCSSDDMIIGEPVVAIGNPLGENFRNTITEGILSGSGRDVSYQGGTLKLLQTSAPLNEGNSGGPLINIYGQVIGVTNMKMYSRYNQVTVEGLGFAIPSETVNALMESILTDDEASGTPALGITVGELPLAAREHYQLPEGLFIKQVNNGSDCKAKGIKAGDILTAVNGKTVTKTDHVLDTIDTLSVGDTMVLTIYRDGEYMDITVALVDMNQVY